MKLRANAATVARSRLIGYWFRLTRLNLPFRKKNVLRIPHGWIYYLAPEIVKQMSPEVDEDQLPFSKAADVYAFG